MEIKVLWMCCSKKSFPSLHAFPGEGLRFIQLALISEARVPGCSMTLRCLDASTPAVPRGPSGPGAAAPPPRPIGLEASAQPPSSPRAPASPNAQLPWRRSSASTTLRYKSVRFLPLAATRCKTSARLFSALSVFGYSGPNCASSRRQDPPPQRLRLGQGAAPLQHLREPHGVEVQGSVGMENGPFWMKKSFL